MCVYNSRTIFKSSRLEFPLFAWQNFFKFRPTAVAPASISKLESDMTKEMSSSFFFPDDDDSLLLLLLLLFPKLSAGEDRDFCVRRFPAGKTRELFFLLLLLRCEHRDPKISFLIFFCFTLCVLSIKEVCFFFLQKSV